MSFAFGRPRFGAVGSASCARRFKISADQGRDNAVRQTASAFHLKKDVQSNEVIRGFPDFVHPLLEALFLEVEQLRRNA
jgi:hypothetical protein